MESSMAEFSFVLSKLAANAKKPHLTDEEVLELFGAANMIIMKESKRYISDEKFAADDIL